MGGEVSLRTPTSCSHQRHRPRPRSAAFLHGVPRVPRKEPENANADTDHQPQKPCGVKGVHHVRSARRPASVRDEKKGKGGEGGKGGREKFVLLGRRADAQARTATMPRLPKCEPWDRASCDEVGFRGSVEARARLGIALAVVFQPLARGTLTPPENQGFFLADARRPGFHRQGCQQDGTMVHSHPPPLSCISGSPSAS